MIQPKFGKQGRMKRNWRAQVKDFAKKHWRPLAYGAAGLMGAVAAQEGMNPSRRNNDLPGPRSPAFYAHRYSHLLPRGAYEAGMRHGTAEQRGPQPRADQAHRGYSAR